MEILIINDYSANISIHLNLSGYNSCCPKNFPLIMTDVWSHTIPTWQPYVFPHAISFCQTKKEASHHASRQPRIKLCNKARDYHSVSTPKLSFSNSMVLGTFFWITFSCIIFALQDIFPQDSNSLNKLKAHAPEINSTLSWSLWPRLLITTFLISSYVPVNSSFSRSPP